MVVLMCAPQDAYQCTRHVSGVEKHDTILSCNKSDTNSHYHTETFTARLMHIGNQPKAHIRQPHSPHRPNRGSTCTPPCTYRTARTRAAKDHAMALQGSRTRAWEVHTVHTCNRHTGNRHPASDAPVASRRPAPRRRSCPQHSRIEPRQALRRSVRPARAPSTFAGKCKKGAESTRGRAGRRGARRGQGGRWTPDSSTYQ